MTLYGYDKRLGTWDVSYDGGANWYVLSGRPSEYVRFLEKLRGRRLPCEECDGFAFPHPSLKFGAWICACGNQLYGKPL